MLFNKRLLVLCSTALCAIFLISCSNNKLKNKLHNTSAEIHGKVEQVTKRIGMVIGLKPDKVSAYEALHADSSKGVRDLLNKYHMHNFSIFVKKFPDGKYYEFGYYEYTGNNYEKDMAALAKEPRNIAWLKKTDPLQIPLKGTKGWSIMKQVYFNK